MDDANEYMKKELEAFQRVWGTDKSPKGYLCGDPLNPMARGYGPFSYISVMHAIYLGCIRPYVNENTTVLEIGPGRGGWTKCFVKENAKKIYALDAKSAKANDFWEYVGRRDNIEYFKVKNNYLTEIPDGSIDYFFTFGVFCHLSEASIEIYINKLFNKMKSGGRGFMMVADYHKYNNAVDNYDRFNILNRKGSPKKPKNNTEPSKWKDLGVKKACNMLTRNGFDIVQEDMKFSHRDPIIHFKKAL